MNYHPRPQLRRSSITLLNGSWDYSIAAKGTYKTPEDVIWQGKIEVPYSPEAPASGINHTLKPDEELWYRLIFTYEDIKTDRLFFRAGAIDHTSMVFLNGSMLTMHEGGYTPVEAELTDNLQTGENTLCLRVTDPSDEGPYARGKQTLKPHGMWYRAQSGIWQSAFLERRPNVHITDFRAEALEDLNHVRIIIRASEDRELPCSLIFNGESHLLITGRESVIEVRDARPWSPEDPYVYPVTLTLGHDEVDSYITIRTVGIRNGRILLNGKEYFCNGILDQGYNDRGLYTFTPQEMEKDLDLIKSLGFNTIRKHIKIEEAWYYYLCDMKGILVWQDMVSGGNPSPVTAMVPAVLQGFRLKDTKHRKLFGRQAEAGRREFEQNMAETVSALAFFGCIILWTIFNEGWGQYDAARLTEKLRELDPTRLIDSTSGWHDQRCGDFLSRHVYFTKYAYKGDKAGRAEILSEFGGLIYRIPGHVYNDKDFIYSKVSGQEEYLSRLKALFDNIREQKKKGLAASIYTQTSDVEEESNGFVTYDRQVVKADIAKLREIIYIDN